MHALIVFLVFTILLFFLQIYIFYGTRSNAEFVIHNGFFFQNNSHDRVKIKLGVSKSERLYAMKAEVLARAGIPAYVTLYFQPFFSTLFLYYTDTGYILNDWYQLK